MAQVEPWLRGSLIEFDPLRRGVIHALWLTSEDVAKWCLGLSGDELESRPFGLPPVAFQLRHIVRSLDRLLTYAEGRQLDGRQLADLGTELEAQSKDTLIAEFETGMNLAENRVRERVCYETRRPTRIPGSALKRSLVTDLMTINSTNGGSNC